MAGTTISGIHLSSLTLSNGAIQNPAIVASGATIQSSGSLGGYAALYAEAGTDWTITNYGLIQAPTGTGIGIDLIGSGTIINQTGGTISGTSQGVALDSGGSVSNQGSILASSIGTNPSAVYLMDGGSVTNLAGGVISAASSGIMGIDANTVTVANQGLITAAANGIFINTGGSVTNQSGGTIGAGTNGIFMAVDAAFYTGSVANLTGGTIVGGVDGIRVNSASVFNQGFISGTAVGLALAGGSTGSNASGGTITGYMGVVGVTAPETMVNAGAILGATTAAGRGLVFYDAGVVTNQSGGTISGVWGVAMGGGGGSVTNAGTITSGSANGGYGVRFTDGGTVTNQSGGTISGGIGVFMSGAPGTLVNAGSIVGGTSGGIGGVFLEAGGTVTNQTGGTITGSDGVAISGSTGSVVNAGDIAAQAGGFGSGVDLGGGGSATNQSTGTISGYDGIIVGSDGGSDGGTVVNAGGISGGSNAVLFTAGVANRLIDDPGATFTGIVQGANTIGASYVSTLELASGSTTGTLSGFGPQFVNFAQVDVDVSATWSLTSSSFVTGVTLANAGTIETAVSLAGGYLTNASAGLIGASEAVTGTGQVVNAGSIAGNAVSGAGVDFSSAGASVTNLSTGTITGASGIAVVNAPATVVNAGSIGGREVQGKYGVQLVGGGGVTNQSTGTISGYSGVFLFTTASTVVNAGVILGSTSQFSAGVQSPLGGYVDNLSSGTISASTAIQMTDAAGTVVNAGRIAGGAHGSGIDLSVGGSITNLSTGTISGLVAIGSFGNNGGVALVVNGGVIDGGSGGGIGAELLGAGSYLTNQGTGIISGYTGVEFGNYTGTMSNAGQVIGNSSEYGSGMEFSGSGLLTNQSAGTISGRKAVVEDNGTVVVVNAGVITGAARANSAGIYLDSGSVTNQSSGSISGYRGIFAFASAMVVVNAGTITGGAASGAGVYSQSTGSVTNQSGGTISGSDGVFLRGGTVVNAGTITGSAYAVKLGGDYPNRLVIDPGAVFSGKVQGAFGLFPPDNTTMELASGTGTGTLSGLGTQFVYFVQTTIDAGAYWQLTGANTLAATTTLTNAGTLALSGATLTDAGLVVNDGTIVLDPSSMTVQSLTGSGVVEIGAGSTLDVPGTVAATETIAFTGANGVFETVPVDFAGEIGGFVSGDTLDLSGLAHSPTDTAMIVPGNTLQVVTAGGTVDLTMAPADNFTGDFFHTHNDGAGGSTITENANATACYCAGTLIRTDRGEVAVETLEVGDHVITLSGEARPVHWIGYRHLDFGRHPDPNQVRPIRIRADAFAEGAPRRDLYVSPDHALYVDGVLVPARLLLNGASIERDLECPRIVYYHIELETHDLLLAEGLAAESYLDTGNRDMFGSTGLPLLPHPGLSSDQARRVGGSCAPFADDPERLEPIWRRLAERAVANGRAALAAAEMTDDPALCLLVDGRPVRPVSVSEDRHVFIVPPTGAAVRLLSRSAVRTETAPWIADDRRLGVLLRGLTVRADEASWSIPLDHPALEDGWWQPEWHGRQALRRWTNGDAVLSLPHRGCVLEVAVAATVPYPLTQVAPSRDRVRPAA